TGCLSPRCSSPGAVLQKEKCANNTLKWLEFCEQFKFLEIKQLTLPPFFVTMFTQLELMHEMYSLKRTY
ncbi:MAG: hypothetical protein J6A50_03415, partial [Clostridia bacterium]|nr:hypothetical protein [Clostridia bacterium]